MWSRYTESVFISRKKPPDVIDSLMTNWIGFFIVMGAILTYNGGEFVGGNQRSTTAAESPFQNGLCDDSISMKLEADPGKSK